MSDNIAHIPPENGDSVTPIKPAPCPTCGTCPTCGRQAAQPAPYIPALPMPGVTGPWWQIPSPPYWWQGDTWCGTGTGATTFTLTLYPHDDDAAGNPVERVG